MKGRKRYQKIVVSFLIVLMMTLTSLMNCPFLSIAYAAETEDSKGLISVPDHIDPQSWKLQRDMTWDDWKDNPFDWDEVELEPELELRGALILVDFPDLPFIVSMEKGSELLGNPVVDAVPEDELAQFWLDFLNTPSELNNYVSINDFWIENSYGKWTVELEAFGPYTLPYEEHVYGMDGSMNQMNGSRSCGADTYNLCKDDINFDEFDFFFVIHAGYDESGVWQEVGEMMFQNKEDVTDEYGPTEQFLAAIADEEDGFGPRDSIKAVWDELGYIPNWMPTRYVPWSSYYAAKGIWSHTSGVRDDDTDKRYTFSVQGENDGMATFAHEFGHIKGLPDNYNNPYGTGSAFTRSYTGSWELMSRGSFAGPGGPHERWQIPSTLGSSAPSPHLLTNSIKQEFTSAENDMVSINRDGLKTTGPVFADIVSRVVPVDDKYGIEGYRGLRVVMDEDYTPTITDITVFDRAGTQKYKYYDVEVVDQVGYDSFALDHGVILTKSRETGTPQTWIVDAHPEDINLVDFVRPDGAEAMISIGDMNQLADACFHAGTAEDVVNEYVDEYNGLHFYILDKNYDDEGVLRYRVAVRHLEGESADGQLVVEKGELKPAIPGRVAVQTFTVTNTGDKTDIVRVAYDNNLGMDVTLLNNLYEIGAGETISVDTYIEVPEFSLLSNIEPEGLTLFAVSETNADKKGEATVADLADKAVIDEDDGKVKVSVSGSKKVMLSESLIYSVSLANFKEVNVISMEFEINNNDNVEFEKYVKTSKLEVLRAAGQVQDIVWDEDEENDTLTGKITLIATGGSFKSKAPMEIIQFHFEPKVIGDVSFKLNDIKISGVDESSVPYYHDFIITNNEINTSITPVYGVYDITREGVVDQLDISLALAYYQSRSGDSDWAEAKIADVNKDEVVDLLDIIEIFTNYTLSVE